MMHASVLLALKNSIFCCALASHLLILHNEQPCEGGCIVVIFILNSCLNVCTCIGGEWTTKTCDSGADAESASGCLHESEACKNERCHVLRNGLHSVPLTLQT